MTPYLSAALSGLEGADFVGEGVRTASPVLPAVGVGTFEGAGVTVGRPGAGPLSAVGRGEGVGAATGPPGLAAGAVAVGSGAALGVSSTPRVGLGDGAYAANADLVGVASAVVVGAGAHVDTGDGGTGVAVSGAAQEHPVAIANAAAMIAAAIILRWANPGILLIDSIPRSGCLNRAQRCRMQV